MTGALRVLSDDTVDQLALGFLEEGRDVAFRVTGNSMRPSLLPGDLVRFEPLGRRRIRRGDVVLYQRPGCGELVAHRVLAVQGRGLRLQVQGDALTTPAGIPRACVRGIAVEFRRGGAAWRMDGFLRRHHGWGLAILGTWRYRAGLWARRVSGWASGFGRLRREV